MSKAQAYAIGSLVSSGLIYLFFQMRMLDGWQVVEMPAGQLFWTYVVVVVLAIVAEIILAGYVFAQGKDGVDLDERDHAIDARAEANAGLFLAAAVNVIIVHAVAMAAFPGGSFQGLSDALALDSPARILFILMSVLFIGHWVKMITKLYLYAK